MLAVALVTCGMPASTPAWGAAPPDKVVGMTISSEDSAQQVTNSDLGRLAGDGVNTAAIAVYWQVDNQTQTQVQRMPTTMSDSDLELTLMRIKSAGMRSSLNILVRCGACAADW